MSPVAVAALVVVYGGALVWAWWVLVWAWWVRLVPTGRRRAGRPALLGRRVAEPGPDPARVWVRLDPPPMETPPRPGSPS